MTQGFIRGDSLEAITKRITAKMNVSKSNVKRLVRTESAAYRSKAQLKAFQDLEVEKYQILATLDARTSDICQDMDGKVFELKDYEIGTTAPPFHVNCRSVTIPYFDDEEEGERTARDPETGKTIYVSDKMTYKEWKQKFLKDNEKDGLKNDENKGIIGTRKEMFKVATEEIIKKYDEKAFKIFGYDRGDGELSIEEWDTLKRYTGNEYKKINAFLRGEIKDDMTYDEHFEDYYGIGHVTKQMRDVLSRYKLEDNLTLFRGVEEKEYLFLKENTKFYQFISTSFDEDVAEEFSTIAKNETDNSNKFKIVINTPKGTKGVYIDGKGAYEDEREFIINVGQKYKKIKEEENILYLEVVLDE